MPQHADLFADDTLFAKLARSVCSAGVLPRKELYEAWELARRVRRRVRGRRVVDLCCGHALLAHVMCILDTSSTAIAHDVKLPASAAKLREALAHTWPHLEKNVVCVDGTEWPKIEAGDVVVSCHACGALSDDVLRVAIAARAAVAVMPCCHDHATCDDGGLSGWLPFDVAVDATRVARLKHAGYDVWTQQIPVEITPKNRILIALPDASR